MVSHFDGWVPGYPWRWAIRGDTTKIFTFTNLKLIQIKVLIQKLHSSNKVNSSSRSCDSTCMDWDIERKYIQKGFKRLNSSHFHDIVLSLFKYSYMAGTQRCD